MMKNNLLCKISALAILLVLLMECEAVPAFAAKQKSDDAIVIRTAEDLLQLAEDCSLDTWSQEKKVLLDCDISLENVDFLPIPTFGGSFDGQGHKITGLNLNDNVSPAGLFGIIQEGASVENLHVSGAVAPGGEAVNAGGICGINYGLIRSCSFQGIAAGEENIGGICGINGVSGMVSGCHMKGNLSGEKRTGGIAGYNLGTVTECVNRSYVNTESVDPSLELEDFQSLEELLRTTAEETYHIATDTGGICGYSTGLVLTCTNEGDVGYIHIGYNVGGIAGRSSGHISSCENKGTVYGRKDVGGIVGQMEPYIILKVSSDWVQALQKEMKTLNGMVNDATDGLEESAAVLSAHMENLNSGIGTAGQLTHSLAGSLAEYGNQTIMEIKRTGEILQASAAQLEVIAQNGVTVGATLGYALQQLELAVDELENVSALGSSTLRRVQDAVGELKKGKNNFNEGAVLVQQGVADLKEGIFTDVSAAENALKTITKGLKQMSQGISSMVDGVEALREALKDDPILTEKVEDALKSIHTALETQADALKNIADGSEILLENFDLDLEKLENGFEKIKKSAASFKAAGRNLEEALNNLEAALNLMKAGSDQMTSALGQIGDAVNSFQSVAWSMTGLMREVEELFDYLSSVNPVQIAHPDQSIAGTAEALYGTFAQMQSELGELNGNLNSIAAETAGSIRKINNQFMVIMDLMMNAVQSMEEEGTEILEDTSDDEIDAVTSGKVYSSHNYGVIYGDVNVGGIAGTMAVESELDPEDDLEELGSSRHTYELKCILQSCSNYGQVTSRKNYAGGSCGKVDLGLVTGCENYGTVSSETGNYVGGIAGAASSAIRHSLAKSFLSGGSYIGGIAGILPQGEAGRIQNCYAMVEITEYDQYAGAICGGYEGKFSKNYFVSDTLAGLNRVSLEGKAEPISYKKLKKVKNLPTEFLEFTLTFTDGENILKTLKFDYGTSFSEKVLPEIPEKEGYYGVWSRTSLENLRFDTIVAAEYRRYVTALESTACRKDGRPVFFTGGRYLEEDVLQVRLEKRDMDEETSTVTENWILNLPDDGQTVHQIRYLKPDEQDGNVKVSVLKDGTWEEVDCEAFGTYVIFEAEGLEVYVQTETAEHSSIFLAVLAGCGAAVLIVIAVIIRGIVSRRKKKNTVQPPVD